MNIDLKNYLKELVENLVKEYDPVSIYVYGSFATNEAVDTSDIDLGFIINDKKPNFNEIKELEEEFNKRNNIKVRIYYFDPNNFKAPFTHSIFIRRMMESNVLLYGKPLNEVFERPKIDLFDIERELGYERAGLIELYKRLRENKFDRENKDDLCEYILYMAACLEMLNGIFPKSFKEMAENYSGEFSDFVKQMYEIRSKNESITKELFYKCLQFSDYVEKEINNYINKKVSNREGLTVL